MSRRSNEEAKMPLQNRVDPFGEIHAVAARGLFTGNRGVIHDPDTRTLLRRRWTTKAWIICECEFRGRRRAVFGRDTPSGNAGWTELFFLDEVTALAAGHRPCFYCRREKAKEFADCFGAGNGIARPAAPVMDAILHAERHAAGAPLKRLAPGEAAQLPDGAMVAFGNEPFAVSVGAFLAWSWAGYGEPRDEGVPKNGPYNLITPPSTVNALRKGYRPVRR